MSPFRRAKDAVERWIRSASQEPRPSAPPRPRLQLLRAVHPNAGDERIRIFIDSLKADIPDWVGKVRLINFDPVRTRVGDKWCKLQDKVELLAERVICDELTHDDRYINIGEAEFLVYFKNSSPAETRVRCLAIVEEIHNRLFGVDDQETAPSQRVAECHVVHTSNLTFDREATAYIDHDEARVPLAVLRDLFLHDAELLDYGEAAIAAQEAFESIISSAIKTERREQLDPLLVRVRRLCRSLDLLTPGALAATTDDTRELQPLFPEDPTRHQYRGASNLAHPLAPALLGAKQDGAQLAGILHLHNDSSHPDMVAELKQLQSMRARRSQMRTEEAPAVTAPPKLNNFRPDEFVYLPIFRSVSGGSRIYEGIYRVCPKRVVPTLVDPGGTDLTPSKQHAAAVEQQLLKHAIEVLTDRSTAGGFLLSVPVCIDTLRSPILLTRYSTTLRGAEDRAKHRLIIEVVGYSGTDNTIGIRRAIEELRVLCEGILITLYAEAPALHDAAAECKRLGVRAIGIDVTGYEQTEPKVTRHLAMILAVGDRYAIPTYLKGVGSTAILVKSIAGGISYVCAPGLRPPLAVPSGIKQVSFDDLYYAI